MTWFRIDDGFYDHPKVKTIPKGALRKGAVSLWTMAGSWCGRYLNDGLVPAHQIEELGGVSKEADALVAALLWHDHDHPCHNPDPEKRCPDVPPGHYLYHEWPEHQPLKAEVEKQRSDARERMRRRRSGKTEPPEPGAQVREMFARTSNERAREQ